MTYIILNYLGQPCKGGIFVTLVKGHRHKTPQTNFWRNFCLLKQKL
jgi:hypothetical protein